MKISQERLLAEAQATGFRPEILEKVFHLLLLLDGFSRHPFLKGRLALKGGTALNLFLFAVPRLSVDIDLNYIAAADRDTMQEERPRIETAIQAVCSREGLQVNRVPGDHAGGKWRLRYASAQGGGGTLEVDINYMFRVPLWPVEQRDARPIGSFAATAITVLDLHELAAGKLAALLARHASRDLFDAHQLLTSTTLDPAKLRLAFVVYGAMNRVDWRQVSIESIDYEFGELESQLIPVVRPEVLRDMKARDWATTMIAECKRSLSVALPFTSAEREFLDAVLDQGDIKPELLTHDQDLQERIRAQPMLQWKALNVRQHRGKG
ncbi:MAG: nucleotidyl transferase AbiEii/AbiGii toxin family protein [Planctomycetota bacterium]|nr:MAG: nucleotidyl transferase AbiEii/AbiGii toxin family protein [Planctomycetota bacterium]